MTSLIQSHASRLQETGVSFVHHEEVSRCSGVLEISLGRVSGILWESLIFDCSPVLFLVYAPKWADFTVISSVYFAYGVGTGLSLNPHCMDGMIGVGNNTGFAGRLCGGENAVYYSISSDVEEFIDKAVLSCSSATSEYGYHKEFKRNRVICDLCRGVVYYRRTSSGSVRDQVCMDCIQKNLPEGAMLSPEYAYGTSVRGITIGGHSVDHIYAYETNSRYEIRNYVSHIVGNMKNMEIYEDGYDPDDDEYKEDEEDEDEEYEYEEDDE
jgi:hypothetical protein